MPPSLLLGLPLPARLCQDNVALLLAGGISCDILPAADGPAADLSRKTKLPRVALSGHRYSERRDHTNAREALPGPQVAYVKRTDPVELGKNGRIRERRPRAYAKLVKQQSFKELASVQRSISLDDLLDAHDFPTEDTRAGDSAVVLSAQVIQMRAGAAGGCHLDACMLCACVSVSVCTCAVVRARVCSEIGVRLVHVRLVKPPIGRTRSRSQHAMTADMCEGRN